MGVLHASYSGWFPFCITKGSESAVGQGTLFPIGLELADAMWLYWKVKTWRVNIDTDGTIADFAFERRGETDTEPNPQNQSDLVCFQSIGGDFFPAGYDQIVINFYPFPSILQVADLYYPRIQISGNVIIKDWNSFHDPAYNISTIDLEFNGKSFPIECSHFLSFPLSGYIAELETW